MAARFWVGGTGTWDASDTTHWASSTGGAGGQSVPGVSDTVTFDGSSGGGTVTVNTTVTVQSIAGGAFTGTLDFATNDNNVTLSATAGLNFSGTGTRTLNMGDGTWTLTATTGSLFSFLTSTNLTLNCNGSTVVFSATPIGSRQLFLNSNTFNNIHINNAVDSPYEVDIEGSATIGGTLTFTNTRVVRLGINSAPNLTVTGAISWTCSAAAPGVIHAGMTAATLTVGAANTLTGIAVGLITKAGAGSITVNDGYDLGGNTGVTINAPAGGGGIGGRVF